MGGVEDDRRLLQAVLPHVSLPEEPVGEDRVGPPLRDGPEGLVVVGEGKGVNGQAELPDEGPQGVLLDRARQECDPLPLQGQDGADPTSLSGVELEPVREHRLGGEEVALAPLAREGHVGHEVDLAPVEPPQPLLPGPGDVDDPPALLRGDGLKQIREDARRSAREGEDLGHVLIESHPKGPRRGKPRGGREKAREQQGKGEENDPRGGKPRKETRGVSRARPSVFVHGPSPLLRRAEPSDSVGDSWWLILSRQQDSGVSRILGGPPRGIVPRNRGASSRDLPRPVPEGSDDRAGRLDGPGRRGNTPTKETLRARGIKPRIPARRRPFPPRGGLFRGGKFLEYFSFSLPASAREPHLT